MLRYCPSICLISSESNWVPPSTSGPPTVCLLFSISLQVFQMVPIVYLKHPRTQSELELDILPTGSPHFPRLLLQTHFHLLSPQVPDSDPNVFLLHQRLVSPQYRFCPKGENMHTHVYTLYTHQYSLTLGSEFNRNRDCCDISYTHIH